MHPPGTRPPLKEGQLSSARSGRGADVGAPDLRGHLDMEPKGRGVGPAVRLLFRTRGQEQALCPLRPHTSRDLG